MGRGGSRFKQEWHDRHLELTGGDMLRWMVVHRPGATPFVAYFRRDVAGGVHEDEGFRLLAEHGHPDAQLVAPATRVGRSMSH